MDIPKILAILQTLEDGAVNKDEAIMILKVIVEVLDKIRPQLQKWWLRIVLDGVIVSLKELREHLEET